jgi:hypothetical protein
MDWWRVLCVCGSRLRGVLVIDCRERRRIEELRGGG